jgi:putative salt-induced outer membrane protein YdiY
MNPAYWALASLASADPAPPPPTPASPLSAFVSQDAPAPAAPSGWTGSIAVGAMYQSGNTDKRTANVSALAERRGENDRWTAKGYWDYSENKVDGDWVLDTRKAGASLKYDYFMSERLYVNGIGAVETDTFADLELRWYAGPGVGYQWQEDETIKWGSEAGVMYYSENRKVDEDSDYVAARLANNLEWQITKDTSLLHIFEVFPSLEDTEDVYAKSDLRLKTSLTEAMFAQIQWVWDYDNTPSAGKERNDHRVLLGIGWSF